MQFDTGRPGSLPRGPAAAAAGRGQPVARRGSRFRRMLAAGSTIAIALLTATAVAAPAQAAATDKVEKQLLNELATKGRTQFLVYLKDQADLSKAAASAGTAKTEYVYNQLTSTAAKSQAGLTSMLKAANVSFTSYWIANSMIVTGDLKVVEAVAARPEVTKVAAVKNRPLITPTETRPAASINAVEWGLSNINAPQVWSQFGVRGEGIVVANIDTGVDFDHPALVGKYRGNLGDGSFDHSYNWFDPSHVCGNPSLVPCDNHDHGTHTMGTMVGDDGAGNQIGVAPGAKWIAAKGCEADGDNGCSDAALLAAGQWVLAPTDLAGANPRPDLRPDIVNNSWGGGRGELWYQATVRAWIAAGIMPVFASGNDGPACLTAESPGDYPESYSVGGYDINNAIYISSGRGTGVGGITKPNISAPAVNVRSSIDGGGYAAFDGTSMAAPHVAGTVALMWSAAPELRDDIAATRQILDDTARDRAAGSCGGTTDLNNDWGEGQLDALQAVTQSPREAVGRVSGVVTDAATGRGLPGVTVTDGTVATTTAADGSYLLILSPGERTLTASRYGYATGTAAVTVTVGGAVTQNFALDPLAVATVTGRVLDGSGHGWPLYARLNVIGAPLGTIFTNPATGAFSFTVIGNATYSVVVTANYPGYLARTVDLVVGSTPVTQDIALEINPATCNAPGYALDTFLSEDFDDPTTPAGWTVVKRNASGAQWAFDDPGGRDNLTGGTGGFAIADSDFAGSGTTTDTDLITPVLDLTGVAAPMLRFNSDFRDIGSEDFTDVDVTTDGGATWTNVYHQVDSRRGPTVEEVALGPAANQSAVQLRFHYFGTWDWWWEIDNVRVVNRSCDPVPGGLVVGFTTDALTAAPLNGVTVTSNDRPVDKGVSAATPDDPNIPDGFYWLFSGLTGAHPFTASRAPYTPVTRTVTVAANSTVQADFALPASRLQITPTKIESYQTLGQTRTTTITVKNTGNGPAEIDLFERGGTFDLLSRQGAPLQVVRVPGGGSPAMVPKGAVGIAQRQPVPVYDDTWTQIDNTPVPISDNAVVWLAGKIYSVGGGSATGNEKKLLVYDPATEDWTTLADMPHARSKPQAANIDDKLYVFGGWDPNGTPEAAVDVYDPESGGWSTLGVTNPNPRSAAGIAVIDGSVYLVGGCTTGSCAMSASTVKFDPTGETFSTVAAYPHSVAFMACGGIGGKAYCAGGVGSAASFTDGFAYDPETDAWTAIATMPVDLWGAAEAAANGLLVLAGGYTDNSAAITNRTIGYDPAADAWVDLPNANFPRTRGGGACGVYKIGGWVSDFTPAPESEALGGLDECAAAAEVPWLSENPESFTLAPGASRKVTVTLAATTAAGVFQPGDYTAEIAVRSNSPYPVSAVDVTMHVLPPASWGKVSGTITGQGCAGTVPLPAQLEITLASNPDVAYPLKAGADGTYAIWLPKGRYDIIVSRDGWRSQSKRHQVRAGFVDVLDFSLRPFVACPTRAGGV
jgi:subtilisin family serine protease